MKLLWVCKSCYWCGTNSKGIRRSLSRKSNARRTKKRKDPWRLCRREPSDGNQYLLIFVWLFNIFLGRGLPFFPLYFSLILVIIGVGFCMRTIWGQYLQLISSSVDLRKLQNLHYNFTSWLTLCIVMCWVREQSLWYWSQNLFISKILNFFPLTSSPIFILHQFGIIAKFCSSSSTKKSPLHINPSHHHKYSKP